MELNFFAVLGMTQTGRAPHARAAQRHDREHRLHRRQNDAALDDACTARRNTPWARSPKALRMELRRDGVHTMLVCPGYVQTGFQQHVLRGRPPDEVLARARAWPSPRRNVRSAIRRGVERDARTVLAPRAGWLLVAAMRLFPSLVEARMAQMNGTA